MFSVKYERGGKEEKMEKEFIESDKINADGYIGLIASIRNVLMKLQQINVVNQ